MACYCTVSKDQVTLHDDGLIVKDPYNDYLRSNNTNDSLVIGHPLEIQSNSKLRPKFLTAICYNENDEMINHFDTFASSSWLREFII